MFFFKKQKITFDLLKMNEIHQGAALFKMVRYVLLLPLRPELDIQLEQLREASSKPAQLKAFGRLIVLT
jgi:hypothetical protein